MIYFPGDRNIHRPPHKYLDNSNYFISCGTFHKQSCLDTDKKKRIFKDALDKIVDFYNFTLQAWIILNNHYHLILKTQNGSDLPRFFQKLHSDSSRLINKLEGITGRKLWYQYWDHCIRGEKDFYKHLNYAHHNCIKHGYTEKMESYLWSSYGEYLRKYGQEWLNSCFEQYPITDFTVDGDNF